LVVRFELAIEPLDTVLDHSETNHGHHEYEQQRNGQTCRYGDQQAQFLLNYHFDEFDCVLFELNHRIAVVLGQKWV
jgi:hypothetical protein